MRNRVWYGHPDTRFIKMHTEKDGSTVIHHRNRTMNFGKGFEGVRRALQYIEMQAFLAKVDGKPIGEQQRQIYPVRRLVPHTKLRTIHYVAIDEEVI